MYPKYEMTTILKSNDDERAQFEQFKLNSKVFIQF